MKIRLYEDEIERVLNAYIKKHYCVELVKDGELCDTVYEQVTFIAEVKNHD